MLVINAYRPRINRILRKNKRRFLSRAEIYFNILININGRTNSWLMVNPIAVDLDHNLNNISSSSLIVILSFFFSIFVKFSTQLLPHCHHTVRESRRIWTPQLKMFLSGYPHRHKWNIEKRHRKRMDICQMNLLVKMYFRLNMHLPLLLMKISNNITSCTQPLWLIEILK